jgi:hypothetical protein
MAQGSMVWFSTYTVSGILILGHRHRANTRIELQPQAASTHETERLVWLVFSTRDSEILYMEGGALFAVL